jgi:putative hydrolase of the HAD superfamily
VLVGQADLLERLDLVVPTLETVSSAELVDYWFARDSAVDEQLLADVAAARSQDIEVHLATMQEPRRARFLWEELRLSEHFEAMHYSTSARR